MKIISVLICTITAFLSVSSYADNESIEEFAKRLQHIISSGDVEAFKQLPCFPSNCIDEYIIFDVFGKSDDPDIRKKGHIRMDGKEGYFFSFLKKSNTKIKISGPYRNPFYPNNPDEYILEYYDPSIVKLNNEDILNPEDTNKFWLMAGGYVVTRVSLYDGKWGFHLTPFNHGMDDPWQIHHHGI